MEQTARCQLCKEPFQISAQDLAFYKKLNLPIPKLCPDDRQRRRASFRNERKLYSRNCDATSQKIISMYSPDKPFKVYDQSYFWSDNWDAADFGRAFDFTRPFFEQFRALQLSVPRLSLCNVASENSYYTNHSAQNKNCYMGVDLGDCQDVYYSNWVTHSKDCIDCSYSFECELGYFLLYCTKCYNCDFCQSCEDCSNCYYCFDCQNCQDCFFCAGLVGKRYCINNEYVGPAAFQNFLEEHSYLRTRQEEDRSTLSSLKLSIPHRFAQLKRSEECTGDYLYNCKNTHQAYDGYRLWDCKFMYESLDCKDSYDCYQPGWKDSELIYEVHAGQGLNKCQFMHYCREVSDCFYCDHCFESQNLFGCVGLRHKEYCILNLQFSKADYLGLLPQIMAHMRKSGEFGEFFPFACSPFGYNESKAQDFYPLTREEALMLGLPWCDYQAPLPSETVASAPDDIRMLSSSVSHSVIKCQESGQLFKIIEPELNFYRRKKLPLPALHPDCRYKARMSLRNPRTLFARVCQQCKAPLISTYAPMRTEHILCEDCYLKKRY